MYIHSRTVTLSVWSPTYERRLVASIRFITVFIISACILVNVATKHEIEGEAFILLCLFVDGIVSMVSSKGAQLKLAEKKRQLSIIYPVVMTNSTTVTKVGTCTYIYTCSSLSKAHFVI